MYDEPKFAKEIKMNRRISVASPYGWPEQMNLYTSYLDLSPIYGSDPKISDILRSHYDGQLLADSYTGLPDLPIPTP